MFNVVEKHTPKKFTAFIHENGIALCSDQTGAFTCIRFAEELRDLKALLDEFDIKALPSEDSGK